MPDHVLESRVWLGRPRPEVFSFFVDPANLVRITPPWLGFRLLTPASPMAAFAVFDYGIRWLGLPLRWRAFIREYDPPAHFVDVQIHGPYHKWEHRHLFVEDRGGTWVEDYVRYQLRLGAIGRVLQRLVVGRQLAAIWAYRRRRIGELIAPALDAPP